MTDKKDTLRKVGESIVEKPVIITVDVKPKNKIHKWLIANDILKAKMVFEVKPQRVGNMYRIASRSVTLNTGELFKSTDTIGTMNDVLARHGEDIFYIVASAIQNNGQEPSQKMIDMVRNEFEMQDVLDVLKVTVSGYNLTAFLNSIALIVGVNALNLNEVSPKENGG